MWITNDPEVAKALKAADAAYDAARAAAQSLPLAEKVAAYRVATEARQAAYDSIAKAGRPAMARSFLRTVLSGDQ